MDMVTREVVEGWLQHLYRATGADSFFEPPFMKVASAHDPLWETFRSVIGPFHWTPQEALAQECPGAAAASVVVFVMPIGKAARMDNRRVTGRPATSWARGRGFGSEVANLMSTQLCLLLADAGHAASSPHQTMTRQKFDYAARGFSSAFSERHAAFVAGLGTFGLSGGLITEHGIAHRIGSIVTSLPLAADTREYGDDPFAWCTRCGACMRRCPAGAIGAEVSDRDRRKCFEQVYVKNVPTQAHEYGWLKLGIGCGLCQTAVPCEERRPVAAKGY